MWLARVSWKKSLAALLPVGLVVLAACTDSESPTPTTTVAPTATQVAIPTSEPAAPAKLTGSGIMGGDAEFDYGVMLWQGYWLSRDHFGPFVMASGMGIPFEPPMEMVRAAMQMVAQNPDDPIVIPRNMLPLRAVFASGSADLLNDPREFDPMDFEGLRLDPATFDRSVTVMGQAQTMLKESQWAHNFASGHFGTVTSDYGAQQRFMGMMVSLIAQMQGQYAMQELMGDDGLYHDSDGDLDYLGNWVMLQALSDIAGLTGDGGGRYANPDAHPMFDNAATQLFRMLEDRDPGSATEAAAAIRALVYRASTASDADVRTDALQKAASIADGLLVGFSSADVVENGAAIVGLVSLAVARNDGRYLDAADRLFEGLAADFDAEHGVFRSKSVYSADDVAWIIGGLNFLSAQGNTDTKSAARAVLLAFYESTIGLAGMQLSAPPGKNGAMAGQWEKDLPSELYYHPSTTPPPPLVGKLTVPAEEITWDGTQWTVTSDRFVTAGAMHLANELNWLGPHLGSAPFPKMP